MADLARLPALADMDPEAAYVGWTITVETDATHDQVAEAFEFVTDDCDLTITPVTAAADPAAAMAGAPEAARPAAAIDAPTAAKPEQPARRTDAAAPQTVRVDVEKVDRLVNLVGELVINQAMLVELGWHPAARSVPRPDQRAGNAVAAPAGAAGRRDGDPHAAGAVGVLAHAAPGAGAVGAARQGSAPGDHR